MFFFVPLVHFNESSFLMLFFKAFDFESALLRVSVIAVDLVYFHEFFFCLKVILNYVNGSRAHLIKLIDSADV